jgi:putative membrane protein
MRLLLKWVAGVVALYATVYAGSFVFPKVLPGQLGVADIPSSFLVVVVLALANTFVRPLAHFLSAPLNCMTFGLMRFVVNALLFWGVAALALGLKVSGFLPALFGSLVYSALGGALDHLVIEPMTEKKKSSKKSDKR